MAQSGEYAHGFNQAKTQVAAHEHYPYGQRLSAAGTAPYHEFTGKPWDPDTRLYYFPYRYYSPGMNRWTTPDPAGLIDGPNVYGYVRGIPVMNIDHSGESAVVVIFTLIGLGGSCYWWVTRGSNFAGSLRMSRYCGMLDTTRDDGFRGHAITDNDFKRFGLSWGCSFCGIGNNPFSGSGNGPAAAYDFGLLSMLLLLYFVIKRKNKYHKNRTLLSC